MKSNFKEIARQLTIVENDLEGMDNILKKIDFNSSKPIIGVTGPPGAGKSTLVNKLVEECLKEGKRVAVLAVDPTSPFTSGSILGDRIRMQSTSTNPNVYIRSVASRGALGGLSSKIIEMTDVLKSFGFDYIFIETVGVGQSEIDVAGLADIILMVLVPESGDEVQFLKAGILEISNAFIINKADREGANELESNLQMLSLSAKIPVFKTTASIGVGVSAVFDFIKNYQYKLDANFVMISKKAWLLIQQQLMKRIDKNLLVKELSEALKSSDFNLYKFVELKIKNS